MYDYSNDCAKSLGYSNYGEYVRSEHWQKLRKKILTAAEYSCQWCGSRVAPQVHHKTYENMGHERDDDLLVVCHECHDKIHWGPFYVDALGSPEDLENNLVSECLTS
jgi:hypothetical protein